MNSCENGGKGGGLGASPGRSQGCEGRNFHPSLNIQEVSSRRRMKKRKRGR
jgi:hypothetical protein